MRKNSYIFTAILAIVASTGAWADVPATNAEREAGTVHDVYKPTNLAESGIAGVTYVNRVGEMAGAAAAAAESHAADASKSAYAAQSSANAAAGAASNADAKAGAAATAAANAQASADAAAAAANSITNGNGITIDTSETGKKKITVNPKTDAGISVDSNGVAVKAGTGISVGSSGVAVKPNANKGISVDASGVAVVPNTNKGISVDSSGVAVKPNANKGISVDSSGVAVVANTNKGISVDANGVAVKAGTGIVVDANGVAVDGAGVTTLGGMYAPATTEEYLQTYAEIVNNGGDGSNLADFRTVALTLPLATELAAEGTLSGAYSTIEDVPDLIPSNYGELKSRPLSAYAFWEGALSETTKQREISEYSYVNISDATKTSNHAVGDVARPVYVMDKITNGVHSGEVAPIQSVTIPVGSENFAETITSTNVAKIWIQ